MFIRALNKALSWEHSFLLLLGASLLYIVPLLMADQTYADDYWRSQLAQGRWTEQGRPGVSLLYMALGFSSGAINLFPLPLLLTTGLLAVSLTRLAHHYFNCPTALNCLIVLPVLYNPFFLQNLSYQYDGTRDGAEPVYGRGGTAAYRPQSAEKKLESCLVGGRSTCTVSASA
ncbi:putative GtrC [Pseudomonas syringae pv. aceris]|uniref:Putative GtrC n=1 Tax=Pseudomonas syringae pv. aceris TaxID=199198 RepID=A0A0N8QA78_PSESX|nr:putative GtrC [Pseudomonas syringae pv. aceris]